MHALWVILACLNLVLAEPQTRPATQPTTRPAAFRHSIVVDGMTIYSTEPIPASAEKLLASVRDRLAGSPFWDPSHRFSVFVCNSPELYTTLTLTNRQSFAVSLRVSGWIVIASADFDKNLSRAYKPAQNRRKLTGVLTHEMAHQLLDRKYGAFARIPRWVSEGYCDYLAGESSFPELQGDRLIADGQDSPSTSFQYFLWRRMVQFLLEQEDMKIEDIIRHPPDEMNVRNKTRSWLQHRSLASQPE